jgi:hypothetical protein
MKSKNGSHLTEVHYSNVECPQEKVAEGFCVCQN